MNKFFSELHGCLTAWWWDHYAPSEDAATEYAHKWLNPDPSPDSLEYILAHTDGEYISNYLRSGDPFPSIPAYTRMFSKYSTKKDIVVYRGVYHEVFDKMISDAKEVGGCDLFDKGFLYTSLVKGHERDHTHKLRIYVPKGSQAIWQKNGDNYEVDIQRGAALKITSYDKAYINCRLLSTYTVPPLTIHEYKKLLQEISAIVIVDLFGTVDHPYFHKWYMDLNGDWYELKKERPAIVPKSAADFLIFALNDNEYHNFNSSHFSELKMVLKNAGLGYQTVQSVFSSKGLYGLSQMFPHIKWADICNHQVNSIIEKISNTLKSYNVIIPDEYVSSKNIES